MGIEKTVRPNRNATREAQVAQERVEGEHSPNSSYCESGKEEEAMVILPSIRTMGDYCIRIDAGKISIGFQPVNLIAFYIKNIDLAGLIDNQIDRSSIRDSWEYLTQF